MNKLKVFLQTTLLGGVIIILPAVIFILVFGWLFKAVTGIIQPMTNIILATSSMKEFIADVIVLAFILFVCFFIGLMIRTRFGRFLHQNVENRLLKIAPGYNLIKETVLQLLGSKKGPFSTVVLVKISDHGMLTTAFLTDDQAGDMVTVFVPTAPTPTGGFICHVKKEDVFPVDVSIEEAMKSIISCGAGSASLIESYKKRLKKT